MDTGLRRYDDSLLTNNKIPQSRDLFAIHLFKPVYYGLL